MNIKDLSFVLIRILALFTIIQGLQQLVNIIQLMYPYFMRNLSETFSSVAVVILFTSLTGVFLLVLGLIIWKKAAWIVSLMDRDHEMNPEDIHAATSSHWYTLGLTLVGIYLFVDIFPNVISVIGQLILYSTKDYPVNFDRERDKAWLEIGVITIKLILALVLVLRPSGLAHLLSKFRGEKSVDEN